jgi:hypothetical protein
MTSTATGLRLWIPGKVAPKARARVTSNGEKWLKLRFFVR